MEKRCKNIYIHIICYYYMDELSERAGGMMDAYYVGKHGGEGWREREKCGRHRWLAEF